MGCPTPQCQLGGGSLRPIFGRLCDLLLARSWMLASCSGLAVLSVVALLSSTSSHCCLSTGLCWGQQKVPELRHWKPHLG